MRNSTSVKATIRTACSYAPLQGAWNTHQALEHSGRDVIVEPGIARQLVLPLLLLLI